MHTISGYGRKPNGPSASPGRYASAAWPMSAGSVAQKSSIPLSIKKKNAHTNAPASAPVAMTHSRKSTRFTGFEKLGMRLHIVGAKECNANTLLYLVRFRRRNEQGGARRPRMSGEKTPLPAANFACFVSRIP